jgi:DNA-binding LacI/PurR family transcriptional regulator/DNA-binding transcriptional regulator YhcF (GntR family)
MYNMLCFLQTPTGHKHGYSMERPAQKKAIRFLNTLIDSAHGADTPLPPLKTLAAQAGISPMTMWKAAQELSRQGKLEIVHGRRMRIARPDTPDNAASIRAPDQPKRSWEKLAKDLAAFLFAEADSNNYTVPSKKELRIRYGVSYATLNRALGLLEQQRVIARYAKGFRIAKSTLSPHATSVVPVLFRGDILPGMIVERFLRSCEHECSRLGLRPLLLRLPATALRGRCTVLNTSEEIELPTGDSIAGYACSFSSFGDSERWVLNRILSTTKPVAVFDQTGGWFVPAAYSLRQNAQLHLFSIADSARAMQQVARFLRNLGHRKVAYISQYHAANWSQKRLNVCIDALGDIGGDEAVVPITNSEFSVGRELEKLWHNRQAAGALARARASAIDQVPAPFAGRIRALFETSKRHVAIRSVAMQKLGPVMKKVFRDKTITAWIGANDDAALLALDYLNESGMQIPKQASVIGFDDTNDAFLRNLTSYSFRIESIASAMLNARVNWRAFKASVQSNPLEIDGVIMERGTTGTTQADRRK